MSERLIELEADTVEEAERKLESIAGLIVLEQWVVCRERVEFVEAVAETVEAAFRKAQSKVPAGAKIESREIKNNQKSIIFQVQAISEESAGKGKAEMITSLSLLKKGRKGFFGFGKTPNLYEVVVSQKAIVELKFRVRAKLRAKVENYSVEKLLERIRKLRLKNAQWMETLQSLNPKNDSEIERSLLNLKQLNPHSVLDIIESACRENEKTAWQTIIKKADKQASSARSWENEEKKVRLRKLDVEIAETFMYYTSVDWYEKDYRRKRKEPTGLPREGYGKENIINPTLRETIPHYSSNTAAFAKLEERIRAFNIHEIYLRLLDKEDHREMADELEQKCVAALKADESRRTNVFKSQTALASETYQLEQSVAKPQNVPAPSNEKADDELRHKLFVRLLYDYAQAFRIVNFLQQKHPNCSERWCWEKAVEDIERDNT